MTLEQYAYLAQILGVIVVVGTLVYLSIQVRQGTELLRSEARQAQVSYDQENIHKFIQHPELGRIYSSKETPSFEEKTQLCFWVIASMRAREHEWLQFKAGSLDETTWLSYRGIIPFALGTERARNLWEVANPTFNPEFVAMVNTIMTQAQPMDLWGQIDAVV